MCRVFQWYLIRYFRIPRILDFIIVYLVGLSFEVFGFLLFLELLFGGAESFLESEKFFRVGIGVTFTEEPPNENRRHPQRGP